MRTSFSILTRFSLFFFICLVLNNKAVAHVLTLTSENQFHQHIQNHVIAINAKVFDMPHACNDQQHQDAEPDLDDQPDFIAAADICGILQFLLPSPVTTPVSERYLFKPTHITSVPRYILFHSLIIPPTV